MLKRLHVYLVLSIFLFIGNLHAMVFDNRFFPLFLKPIVRTPCNQAHSFIQPFFMHAERALGEKADERDINIPDIYGRYDLIQVINGGVKAGIFDNPLRTDLQGTPSFPFRRDGRIDTQGMAFWFEWPVWCNVSLGIDFLFMRQVSRFDFCLDATGPDDFGAGDRNYFFMLKEKVHQELGITPPLFSKNVFGDTDVYLRWSQFWPYTCKFRSIDLGFRVGMLAPSAPLVESHNPASFPVGGNGHWGAYVQLENQYEVREDWFATLMFRASKRFKKTVCTRTPVGFEPENYGPVIAPLAVTPGWTFVFNPSIRFEGVRDGLGFTALYTLVAHLQDDFQDMRADQSVELNLKALRDRSSWGSEYVTIGAFYDFAKFKECRWYLPTLSLYWDIPVDWLTAKRFVRTNAVSLMLKVDF